MGGAGRVSSRFGRQLLAGLAVVSIVAGACGPSTVATPSPEPQASIPSAAAASAAGARGAQGTLTLFYWQAPTILNPHLSQAVKDQSASRITYEPLASFDADGDLVPFLAAEVPTLENGGVAADGKSVTWRLRPGMTWSDGEPFTAEDVVFTWRYVTNPDVASVSAGSYAAVKDVEAIDDTTVKVTFHETNPAWSIPFTGVFGMIIPEHVFADYLGANAAGAPANLKPIGTGPFRVVEFVNEDVLIVGGDAVKTTKIVYEANPEFRDPDRPAFARVELRGGGGDAVVASQLMSAGESDYAWNLVINDDEIAAIESTGKSKVETISGAFTERIMLNFSDPDQATADGERSSAQFPNPAISDAAVRLAIAQGVDRAAITALYGRGGTPAETLLVSPANFRSDHPAPPFDLEAAAKILDDAGWTDHDGDGIRDKDGASLRLLFQTSINPVRQQAQAIVKEALDSIGFRIDLKNIDSSIFLGPVEGTTETRRQFYADLEEYAFSNKSPDPTVYMAAWTCDEFAQMANDWSKSNFSRYCDATYDDLFSQALVTLDPDARVALFKAMNDRLIDEAAVIPLVHLADISGRATTLHGLELTPWDVDVWNIGDWTRS
jgi:peptide/nickel transport system substrate-binding protein